MQNIKTNFSKCYAFCKEVFAKHIDSRKNFQLYPAKPKMNDLEVVSLACCMEALGIDSENLLGSKMLE